MAGVRRHTVCWLICCAQTPWNREHRYLSRTDVPLTSFGRARARGLGRRLDRLPLTALVHSDLQQTRETAAAVVARRATLPPVAADNLWRERDWGHWEGLTYKQVIERFENAAGAFFADPWTQQPP